jgi:hypothetical protein
MSNFLDCCLAKYRKNDTDAKAWMLTVPDLAGCAATKPDGQAPFPLGDGNGDCDGAGACNFNAADSPYGRGTVQSFEDLGLMLGVTFTYSSTTITAHKTGHGLKRGGEPFTIYGQTGNNAVLNGSWNVATIPDANSFTFTISTPPAGALSAATLDFRKSVNLCVRRSGWKGVQSGKAWLGRNDFTTDYIAHPEQATTRWRAYDVSVDYSQGAHEAINTVVTTAYDSSGGMSGGSSRGLTAGGVEDCNGYLNAGLRSGECAYYGSVMGGANCFVTNEEGQLVSDTPHQIEISKTSLKAMCAVNSDRRMVTCTVPICRFNGDANYGNFDIHDASPSFTFGLENFVGTPEEFPDFLARFTESQDVQVGTPGDFGSGHYTLSIVNSGSIQLLNDEVRIHVEASGSGHRQWQGDCDDIGHDCRAYYTDSHATMQFNATATLSDSYTLAQCDADAKALLNEWDMTRDDIYPWRQDGGCNICPFVSRWEIAGAAPNIGYCDTAASADALAFHDGSIRGAPISSYNKTTGAYSASPAANYPVGLYDDGWFDWAAVKYGYSDIGDGSFQLCYQFGQYVTDQLGDVSMATQFTPGASDTSDRGGFWQPFSRYKYNYNLPLPPWINNSGAYAVTDGNMVYAAKWAELKEPLPSQNVWGECGAMRLSADYPSAYGICGKMYVVSAVQSGGNVVITTAASCWLKNGDSVDFTSIAGLGSNVTVAGLSGSVAEVTSFTVAGTLTSAYVRGGYVQSHGSQSAVWYDLAPKGYFVRSVKAAGVQTAEEGNVSPHSGHRATIAILPQGSPELNIWPADSTVFYTDYGQATIPPVGTDWGSAGWYCAITQGMPDRFVINAANYVEARLHAPTGAPLQFTADNLPQWHKMPAAMDFGFVCDGAWGMTDSPFGFDQQYGVSTNTADALNTSGISSASDAGWGTADATFIP